MRRLAADLVLGPRLPVDVHRSRHSQSPPTLAKGTMGWSLKMSRRKVALPESGIAWSRFSSEEAAPVLLTRKPFFWRKPIPPMNARKRVTRGPPSNQVVT